MCMALSEDYDAIFHFPDKIAAKSKNFKLLMPGKDMLNSVNRASENLKVILTFVW